jgi:uncharacterized protein (TIGR02117 family)
MVARYLSNMASFAVFLVVWLMASGCAPPLTQLPLESQAKNSRTIFVVNYGWHTSIVLKKGDIESSVLPELRDFSDAEYVDIGWGDWDYYQAPDPGLGLALKAAFWSSRSVLHVMGFNDVVENYFSGTEMVRITLSDEAFRMLIEFVAAAFLRPDGPGPVPGLRGLTPNSRFYPATGRFHLFRTCNTWVAEALHAAALPIAPVYAFTAGNLSHQVKRIGTVVKLEQRN